MSGHEFETEPVRGIPDELPEGERILWQGVPTWRSLMVHVLHVRWLAAYFAVIMVVRAYSHLASGNGWGVALLSASWLGVLGLFVITLMAGVAFLMKRSTVYTITSERLILRYGMVLPVAVNLPFSKITSVDIKTFADGTSEIPITVSEPERLVYGMMWPHAKRWHFVLPTPMLRSVPDGIRAAGILANAIIEKLPDGVTAGATAAARAQPVRAATGKPSDKSAQSSGAGLAVPA